MSEVLNVNIFRRIVSYMYLYFNIYVNIVCVYIGYNCTYLHV